MRYWITKKGVLSSLLLISLFSSGLLINFIGLGQPVVVKANAVQQLERELEQIKQESSRLAKQRGEVQAQVQSLENEKQQHQQDIMVLDSLLNETQGKIEQKEAEITKTEEDARLAAIELQEAEERVELRNELIKTRMRAMYESGGDISYLEVLLGSSDFGDFLERLDFLGLIMEQDQKILADFVRDKEIVEQKKLEIENLLVRLGGQLGELELLKTRQEQQQRDLEKLIVRIAENQKELLELDEELRTEMLNYASKQQALQSQLANLRFDGVFTWPVPDSHRITSNFGLRPDPFTGRTAGHSGTDIGAPQGTTIVAAADGVVTVAELMRGYGNAIIIEHGNNTRTLYGHIRHGGIMVQKGQRVTRGQKIAEVGSTGRSTGPHLHFEVHENGKQVDPMKYLKK